MHRTPRPHRRPAASSLALLDLCAWSATRALAQPPAAPPVPPVVSPGIAASGDVTLRLRAPQADKVIVMSGGDIPGLPREGQALTKGADGVWQLTFPKLASGAYRYRYVVDGVPTNDPENPATSQSNTMSWSLFYVPGAKWMDEQRVPHGAVETVHYYSSALGKARRMQVYTPPGYEGGGGKYPVFYLLHGAFDSDDAWPTVGRAGFRRFRGCRLHEEVRAQVRRLADPGHRVA
jgi:hypothetical protein